MADEPQENGWIRLGVAAAMGREYAADAQGFLPFLARLLESGLPDSTTLRTQGLFKKRLVGVTVDLGSVRYVIDESPRGGLEAARTQVVRGIALKTESVAMEDCLKELEAILETRASENARARAALAQTLGLE